MSTIELLAPAKNLALGKVAINYGADAVDMSYAKPGMYIVRLGTVDYGKVKKIIVK